jgi:hypothetical protein
MPSGCGKEAYSGRQACTGCDKQRDLEDTMSNYVYTASRGVSLSEGLKL